MANTSLVLSKTVERKDKTQLIPCACGCGTLILKYDNRGRRKYFYKNHRIMYEDSRKQISESLKDYYRNNQHVRKTGSEVNGWKGDDVSRFQLHRYVRRHFYKPLLCQMCMKVPPKDLANITGIYNREFKNWRYYCCKCHKHFDNQPRDLKTGRFLKKIT